MITALAILLIICTYLLCWLIYTHSELVTARETAKLWYETLEIVAQQRDETDKENQELKNKLRCLESSMVKWDDLNQ